MTFAWCPASEIRELSCYGAVVRVAELTGLDSTRIEHVTLLTAALAARSATELRQR